jgi:hypothetical protein
MFLALWLAAEGVPPANAGPPLTVRRLNRAEYNHTVADLLGTALRPADDFPADEVTFGFDNIAASHSVSPVQARFYGLAARALVRDAFERGGLPGCETRRSGCIARSLLRFAAAAWRRPLTAEERSSLLGLQRRLAGAGDHDARQAFEAVLVSPHFLFRIERDAGGRSWDHVLASRLSYFLWSTLPDARLSAAAATGSLRTPSALRDETARLIADPRADRFVASFSGQWLSTRVLDGHYVDRGVYGAWDDELAASMKQETALFFAAFLRERLPVPMLLTARFTYVDDRLARHYGLPAAGPGFRRVELGDGPRSGILGHGSVLVATSHANRSGVVKRGQWVLGQLLCDEPPPAPPGVPALPSAKQVRGSQRDRLEEHRAEVSCAACHKVMDAIGFGLENYDGVGAWRTVDEGAPIDASGKLPGGATFDGPRELAALLARDPRFVACTARHLFTYALGRPPLPSEEPTLATMRAQGSLRDMIDALVVSPSFRAPVVPR